MKKQKANREIIRLKFNRKATLLWNSGRYHLNLMHTPWGAFDTRQQAIDFLTNSLNEQIEEDYNPC